MKRLRTIAIRWMKRTIFAVAILFLASALVFTIAWFTCPLPIERLDQWPTSPRVMDRNGQPLLELVGLDDQWRMQVPFGEISPWLIDATIATEDERFRSHPGVDPIAIGRATWSNLARGRIVSGASTITMQVSRMMDDRPRTWRAKIIESFRALQLESLRSKDGIIEAYLNIAPYGGNLRGVEAASLRYFGKRAKDLSLAEAAMIAGLPQSPSRLRPDRYFDRAKARQEFVLNRMTACDMITQAQATEAAMQPLHLLPRGQSLAESNHSSRIDDSGAWLALSRRPTGGTTTLDDALMREIERLAQDHLRTQPPLTDCAIVVIDIDTGKLLAMIGSMLPRGRHMAINAALAPRSPGSTLKPFVYAAGFESQRLNETSTLHDGPIQRGGWSPSNFDRTFSGDVTVTEALRRSLNVLAILAAEGVGLPRCTGLMQAAGIRLPMDAAARGGLAVVTGAVEVSLFDLTNAYATLGRGGTHRPVRIYADEASPLTPALTARSCAMLDEILGSQHRSPRGMELVAAADRPWFMWKTGTSSGRRDAWAIGHNRKVAIGIWTGRQSGSGDVQYVGSDAAEPLLAKLFDLPSLRSSIVPAPAKTWVVQRPLPLPREATANLRISSPAPGSSFIAVNGVAIVHPRASHADGPQWFLNGRLLDGTEADRLLLNPGRYELRCTQHDGTWATSAFEVR